MAGGSVSGCTGDRFAKVAELFEANLASGVDVGDARGMGMAMAMWETVSAR